VKNLALSFLFLSALVAGAQETTATPASAPPTTLALAASETPSDISQATGANSGTTNSAPADAQAAAPKKKAPPAKDEEIKRPPIDASMVGYIENAIVGSEVRVRFDAAFNDAFPDRAEFIYGKCGCYRSAPPPFLDPNAPGPGPGIPKDINFQTLEFMAEYAPTSRFSAFVQLPIRWLQPEGVISSPVPTQAFLSSAGIGDVQAGVKVAMLAMPKAYVSGQFKAYFPSGASVQGLGTNHYSIEPAILYYGRLSERFELEGEIGGWVPIGGSAGVIPASNTEFAGNIFFYGIGPSYRIIDGEKFRLSPVIELVGWNVTSGQETGAPTDASGTNIVNLKIGARMSFQPRNSIYIGYGKALTSAAWYEDIVRVEYRRSF
jgi:Putative MetA-pathway of phenol degradation